MSDELEQAFLKGMCKRAMEKKAFVGGLAGGLIRGIVPYTIAGKALSGIQSRVLPHIMSRPGFVGRAATKLNNGLNTNIGGMVGHMGMHQALSPVIDPAVGYVANKFDGQGY